MANTRKLTVEITGNAAGLTSAVGTAESKVGRLGGKISGLSTTTKVAFAGAATAVAAFGTSSVKAFVEAETAQSKLTAAFEKYPQLAGSNADALRALNTELAKKTQFDDDATASGQAVLAGFGLTEAQLRQVTPLLQDYAAKTGKDLPSAATDLGKAILGQGRALKGVGINFEDTGSAAGNFEELLGGLNDKVGGFAEVAGGTAAGKAAILKNQFGELQEKVGAALVPALTKLADIILSDVLPVIERVGSWLAEHKPVLIAVAAVIGTGLVVAFVAWAAAAASAAAATLAATWPIIAIGAAIAALVAGVIWAYQNWGWFHDAVDAVASFITGTLWPALQSVASFFTDTLVPAISTTIGWIRDHWQELLAIITGPIGAAVYIITTHWDTIKAGATAVKDWIVEKWDAIVTFFAGLPDRISAAASAMWDGLKNGLKAAIDWIVAQIDRALGPLDELLGGLSQVGIGSGNLNADVVRRVRDGERASGGPVMGGSTYLVGERGPELLTMGASGYITPNSAMGGGQTVVNVDMRGAVGLNGPEVEKWVRSAVQDAVRRDGKIPGTNIVKATP